MSTMIEFQYAVPTDLSSEESALYVKERIDELVKAGVLDAVAVSFESVPDDDGTDFTLEDQLDRFATYWQARAPYLRATHEGLVALGYTPILPEIRSAATKTPASYIRYVDPKTSTPLGAINSGAFLFTGARAKERLTRKKMADEKRDGMRVQFEDQDKVEFILKIAKEFKS
jgi:hypothetical protein